MAEKRTVILNVETKQSEKNVESLNTEIKQTSSNLDGVSNAADKATGGAITKFKALTGSVKSVTMGFKTLRGAILASGIGALVIGVVALVTAFKSSEEGQNKFAKIMGVIGAITGNFVDLLADLGEKIIGVFENPKQAIKDFVNLLKNNIINRFEGLIELIPQLGKSIQLLFKGQFKEAGKTALNAVAKVSLGVEDMSGKIESATKATKGFIDEQIREANIAAGIADKRASAEKKQRDLIVERAKAEQRRADLLEKAAAKDQFTAEQRIKFLEEAAALDEEITNKAIAAAKLKLEAKQQENALARSTKADLEEEARLEAELINLETNRLRKAKATTAQIVGARREAAAEQKALDAQTAADKKAADDAELLRQKEKADAELAIRDAVAISQAEKDALEIQKAGEKYDALIERAKKFGLDTTELEKSKEETIAELKNKFAEQNSSNEIKWEKLTQTEKNMIVAQGLNNLSTILGKESAAGKAAAIAAATIQTYESATASYKSLAGIPIIGPALGAAAAGAAIVSGLANVKKIVSTKTPQMGGAGGGGGASGGRPSAPTQSTPPAFNVVGGSTANQLGDVIAESTKKPVKAYVTSNDVTSAQSLDRNIIEEATIG